MVCVLVRLHSLFNKLHDLVFVKFERSLCNEKALNYLIVLSKPKFSPA